MPVRALRLGAATIVCLLVTSRVAAADVADYVGKPLADVRVELGGEPFGEAAVLELVETRVGEPLRLEAVRETIDHLVGLGRFEDVRVYAEPSAVRPGAVSLRWVLSPVQRIREVDFAGSVRLNESDLRNEITERIGSRPSLSRSEEILDLVRTYYADRGYRSARIATHVEGGPFEELVTLVVTVDAGYRTRIRRTSITGSPPAPPERLVSQLGLTPGTAYDAVAIGERLEAYEESLRALGHYEAQVVLSATFSEDNTTADLVVDIDPGARVRVVFEGDPLPDNRRDQLVPIRRERSVDLDLLEDASRNIETFLRQQGYRAAQARYTREQVGNETVLTFTITRGPLHTLESAQILGNQALSTEELARLLQLKPGEPFVDSRAATVASAMTELYRVRGFARALVKPDIRVGAIEPGSNGTTPVELRYQIVEGPQTIVNTVEVTGTKAIPERTIRALLTLTSGRPFYRPQLDTDRDAIERFYRSEGFQSVRVTPESALQDDGQRIDIRWQIREGPRTTIDHVLIPGNAKTSADLIRREVVLEPGRPLSDDAIVESQRRLAALGLFRRVRIVEIPHGANDAHDVLVEVEEAPATTISEGGGVEALRRLRRSADGSAEARLEIAPRGFFEITRRNLWGKNRSVSAFTRVSFRPRDPAIDSDDRSDTGGYGFHEYRVVGTLREPRPFNRAGEAQLTGFFEQAVRSSFNFSRRGARAEYARRIGTALTISGRYAFDHTRLFDEQIQPDDRLLVDRLFPQVRLSTFTGSVLRDSRDDVLDPERGSVTGIDLSVAPRWAGSEVGFARTFVQGFTYRRLPGGGRVVLAAGARVGLAVGFERRVERLDENGEPVVGPDGQPIVDVVKDLPASERFYAGGDTTVRGFVLDQLGAEDTLNDQGFPTGGNALVVLNLELRAPYWKGLGPVIFFDTGNVFQRASHVSLADLRPAAGFGLRYRSPLGPLRFDLGFNLDRRTLRNGDRERGMVFHISLGQAF